MRLLTILHEAEAHWRSEADLEATSLPGSGTFVHRFTKWTSSFYGRLQEACVDGAIAAAKLAEGPGTPAPGKDGLSESVDTTTLQKKRQSVAKTAVGRILAAAPSKYRALVALKPYGTNEAMMAALSCDPERAYLGFLTQVANETIHDTDSDNDEEDVVCGREECKDKADDSYYLPGAGSLQDRPLCGKCHSDAVEALGLENKRKKPGHKRWKIMCSHWIKNNPKSKTEICWSCASNACADEVKAGRHWCKPCSTIAIEKLQTKSGYECDTWGDESAETYLRSVREAMKKGGSQDGATNKGGTPDDATNKGGTPDGATNKGGARSDAQRKKGLNPDGKPDINELSGNECELCGLACGEDRIGRVSSETPPPRNASIPQTLQEQNLQVVVE